MNPIKSPLLDSIPHLTYGFGTKDEPIPKLLRTQWETHRPQWKQVHGVAIANVQNASQNCGEVDGLFTLKPKIPIGIVTADCVPVLLAHRSGKGVAGVHAGWRGTRQHILRHLWDRLKAEGEKPENWVAAIGPSIGPCCYQVSEDLAEDFAKEFSVFGPQLAVPRHRILDLPAINAEELKRMGIQDVDLIRACTHCSTSPSFHSYRREGGGTRQYSMISSLSSR